MESEMLSKKEFGGSLPVENVQALASRSNLKEIPTRHLRPKLEFEEVSVNEILHAPVIDMTKLRANETSYQDELAKLHLACKDWGFFQLINHGVSEEVIEKMKIETQEFFKLSMEEKSPYA
ncbi:2-oxoglutarate (2OG) and Fe(II)-dependent oxygenase superfamily protein [Quillaja saponaria]|uniref:2-oxoglutarate (2OG) and Fe(II)-dependent oxygenase superfamily protein n=1 Tax=Quillaja saponaria TaxID=32244 RepID=A0AAD7KRY1_QUISA|nr:2-oxoglutarate (2OG) and Fe(II)-dependent oxygenase superfamily protein [Quillaja saponaria]